MTDPLSPTDPNSFPGDGGLNSSDTGDWADPKTTSLIRTMAIVVLPLVFVAIALFALFLLWQRVSASAPAKPVIVAAAAPLDVKDAEIAQLQGQLASLQTQLHPAQAVAPAPAPATVPAQPVYATDPGALARLSGRIDRIEANQKAIAQASVSATAAAVLQQAARGPGPFLNELASVQTTLNAPSLTAPLQPLAEHGVPTAVSLAIAFPAYAARANAASKAAAGDHSLLSRLEHALGSFINIRRIDQTGGQGTEDILARAEDRLNSGDLKGAVAYLNSLSPAAREAIDPWLAQAQARVSVDDTTAKITATALNHLSQINFDTSQDLNGQTAAGGTL